MWVLKKYQKKVKKLHYLNCPIRTGTILRPRVYQFCMFTFVGM